MGRMDKGRLAALEAQLGHRLPPDLVAALSDREPVVEGDVALVTPDEVWPVRTTYRLDGDEDDRLGAVYKLVGDALPPGAVPFAEDWAGDYYCLMLEGPYAGQVVYWWHEREAGDHRVKPVAASVSDFLDGLVAYPPREPESAEARRAIEGELVRRLAKAPPSPYLEMPLEKLERLFRRRRRRDPAEYCDDVFDLELAKKAALSENLQLLDIGKRRLKGHRVAQWWEGMDSVQGCQLSGWGFIKCGALMGPLPAVLQLGADMEETLS
jgi:hypothetical protein